MGAYGSEVKATLGVDTTQVPADMVKARAAFNKGAADIEQDSAKRGAGAGDKLVGALEHKLLGARHLSGALATALGLNIEHIAESITSAIVGGSKEGWKQAGEIAERNAELIGKVIESRMNPRQIADNMTKELERAEREMAGLRDKFAADRKIKGTDFLSPSTVLNKVLAGKDLTADELRQQEKIQGKILALQERINAEKKSEANAIKAIDDEELTAAEKKGTLAERARAIQEHIKKLQLDYVNGDYTELELKKKKLEIDQKQNELAAIHKDQKQKELDLEKKTLEIAEKKAELGHQKVSLAKDEAKLTDRSKLTVGELAALHENKRSAINEAAQESERNRNRSFEFGRDADLTSEQASARDKAEEIKDLEAKAERARKSGDTSGASSILDQVGQMRDALVKSGFTKSTEGDPATALREQIAKDNDAIKKTLSSIETIEKGKYINQ